MLILDGTLEGEKNIALIFSKISVFTVSFFSIMLQTSHGMTWQEFENEFQLSRVNFGWMTEKFWGSVVFYILRPSSHCDLVVRPPCKLFF